jgi:hypothetical protein
MNPVTLTNVLDAAAYALVSQRCRQATLHDIRGGLQALQNAIELLARSAKAPVPNPATVAKVLALATRAMTTHEQLLVDLVRQTAPSEGPATMLDLGELVQEVLRFLRNDALAKSISLHVEAAPGLTIMAQPDKCRLLILGIAAASIDALPPGSAMTVGVAALDDHVLLEFKSAMRYSPIRSLDDLGHDFPATLAPHDLLLALAAQWLGTHGGRIELAAGADGPQGLHIYYPAAARGLP